MTKKNSAAYFNGSLPELKRQKIELFPYGTHLISQMKLTMLRKKSIRGESCELLFGLVSEGKALKPHWTAAEIIAANSEHIVFDNC
jgi:hypothetical protein